MVLRPRQRQLVEEDARELGVVVLAGVDEHLVGDRPEPVRHRRRLDELGPVSDYGEYTHEFGVRSCLDMSALIENVRGTVQGMLHAAGHIVWYVDWHTGGQTARQARR